MEITISDLFILNFIPRLYCAIISWYEKSCFHVGNKNPTLSMRRAHKNVITIFLKEYFVNTCDRSTVLWSNEMKSWSKISVPFAEIFYFITPYVQFLFSIIPLYCFFFASLFFSGFGSFWIFVVHWFMVGIHARRQWSIHKQTKDTIAMNKCRRYHKWKQRWLGWFFFCRWKS